MTMTVTMIVKQIKWVGVWWTFLLLGIGFPSSVDSALSPIRLGKANDFCKRAQSRLDCNFKNTDQPVILEDIDAGIKEVKVQSAKTFRGVSLCNTNIVMWTSSNVTLLGSNPKEDVNTFVTRAPPTSAHPGRKSSLNLETVNHETPILFPSDGAPATTAHQPSGRVGDNGQLCDRNVSVHQSKVRLLQGGFSMVFLQSSEVESVDGLFQSLLIKQQCEVKKFSGSVDSLVIQETQMAEVTEMKVGRSLQVQRASMQVVGSPGIVLNQFTKDPSKVDPSPHEMTGVSIGSLKTGKIIVNGSHLIMNSVTIDEIGAGGISIEAGGRATLNNVKIGGGPDFCLVLRGSASITLNNFTLRGETLDHLDLTITNAKWPVYPLHVLPTQKTRVQISLHQNASSNNQDSKSFISLDWYWVPVMLVVGMVCGMVVACAVRCSRRRKRPNELLSSLSFSELVARERRCRSGVTDEEVANGYVGPHHPDLVRQDSGLTSSSFASYTACAERRHSSKQFDDLDRTSNGNADSSVFIHVPAIACTRENVIYEEVESLPPQARENTYVAMK
ncbi:uncharacterized protein LOC135205516 [Macrobrachium nipponense]|uniref:uncharacterized protein LOC135205516 n=1 Tax=Macrobrachium nipponense TaxID=159736 RepID=UPI0030C7C2B7